MNSNIIYLSENSYLDIANYITNNIIGPLYSHLVNSNITNKYEFFSPEIQHILNDEYNFHIDYYFNLKTNNDATELAGINLSKTISDIINNMFNNKELHGIVGIYKVKKIDEYSIGLSFLHGTKNEIRVQIMLSLDKIQSFI